MCGIYGFCGLQTKKTAKIVKRLGLNNISRGRDSTGLAVISKNKIELDKSILDSFEFFKRTDVVQKLSSFRKEPHTIAIGHTRFATRGEVKKDNAHPFQIGNVLFAHNGIISNFDELQKKHKTEFEVDSQIIGYLIATEGMKKAFESIIGSFTVPFIMVDDPEVLHIATHNQDLAFAIRGRQMYYSSDIMDLKDALRDQKGFTFCEGGNSLIYSFFDTGERIEISKEVFKAKKWVDSYTDYYREWSTYDSSTRGQQLSLIPEDKDCNDFQCFQEHEHEYILNDHNLLIPNPKHQYYKASASDDDKKVKNQLQDDLDEYYREFGEDYVDNYDTCNRLQCFIKHEHRYLFTKYSDNTWKLIPNPKYDEKKGYEFQKFLEGEID